MDFEKALQDDLNDVAQKVEAGLEKVEIKDALIVEEVEKIVRSVVKEELAVAVKDIKKYISTVIIESRKADERIVQNQKTVTNNVVKPNIECSLKVSYDVRREISLGMTCGGWTFGANRKEGMHLWAVNEDGSKYYELYPKTIGSVSKIEEGYVYFTDADYNHLRVSINDGKIEKVKDY